MTDRRTFIAGLIASSLPGQRAWSDSSAPNVISTVYDLAWIPDGNSRQRCAYVIFAPWCPVCKDLYRASRSWENDVQLRWIPSGTLDQRSLAHNATLASSRSLQALNQLFTTGSLPSPRIDSQFSIDLNEGVIFSLEKAITKITGRPYAYPTVIYESATGPAGFAGLPQDAERQLDATVIRQRDHRHEPRSSDWLSRIIIEAAPSPDTLITTRRAVPVHALPFEDAPLVGVTPNAGQKPLRAIATSRDGTWYAFNLLGNGVRGFVSAGRADLVVRT